MEETDTLGDRISVMAHGQLQAICSSLRLKAKFGAGYRFSCFVGNASNHEACKEFVLEHAPEGNKLASAVEGEWGGCTCVS